MRSPYRALGIPENALLEDAEKRYGELVHKINKDFGKDRAATQARRCRSALDEAITLIRDETRLEDYKQKRDEQLSNLDYKTRPRLGQLCVASGIISVDQLQEAVEAHMESGEPLGEILEDKQFISRAELEGLLMGQDLIDVDSECTDPLGLRLISMNLANEDMVLIAQLQMRITDSSLLDVFLDYGWIEPELAQALQLG